MRVVDIVDGTSVDGPGLRTTIYFAGCSHHCPGCHNPHTWDYDAGAEIDENEIMKRIIENDFDVTFSGGDPMYQAEKLISLAQKIKSAGKTLWCYTGFTFEQTRQNKAMDKLLDYIDVLVDGRFIESLRDTSLIFKGSSNQRLIDVKASKNAQSVIEINIEDI